MQFTGPAVILIALVIAAPTSARTQLSHFQGTWLRLPTDSQGVIDRLDIRSRENGIRARVMEDCGDADLQDCSYEVAPMLYGPSPTARADSLITVITIAYQTREWSRLAVLTWSSGALIGDVYSSPVAERSGSSGFATHQTLRRAYFAMQPPPPPLITMPQFPWPPPPATAREQLPAGLVTTGPGEQLGNAFDRIRQALRRGDVRGWSVYAIKDSGFAVVTRLETITADGTPKPGAERWSGSNDAAPQIASIADYLRALFVARPGHYRVIVLAVTAEQSGGGSGTLSPDSAAKLLARGTDDLPPWLRERPLPIGGRCVAFVYEFRRKSENDQLEPVSETSGLASAPRHLVLAGLWSEEAFRR